MSWFPNDPEFVIEEELWPNADGAALMPAPPNANDDAVVAGALPPNVEDAIVAGVVLPNIEGAAVAGVVLPNIEGAAVAGVVLPNTEGAAVAGVVPEIPPNTEDAEEVDVDTNPKTPLALVDAV